MPILKLFRRKTIKAQSQNPSPVSNVTPATQTPSYEIGTVQRDYVITSSGNAAFQEAWKQHWEDLSEAEKEAWSGQEIRSPLQVSKTVEQLSNSHRKQTITGRITDRTLKFLRVINLLMGGVTLAIQAHPEAAVRYFEYYEKLTEMMEDLATLLDTLEVFNAVKSGEPRLHKTLVAIYSNVLSFCKHARRAYIDPRSQKSVSAPAVFVKVQWSPFEEKYQRIRVSLEQQVENLKIVSAAIIMKATSALEEDMEKKKSLEAGKERQEFLEWIFQDDIELVHKETSKKRHGDTASWLLETKPFEAWIQNTHRDVLWLNGPAGTGKSVLASVAINHLIKHHKSAKVTVIYVYFKGLSTNLQHMPLQMISSLLKQLCWDLPTLPDTIIGWYHDFRMNARRPSFEDIEVLFLQCTKLFERVFIVLDGLDECAEKHRKPIMRFICEVGVQSGNVKAFVASRAELDILRTFGRHNVFSVRSISSSALQDVEKLVKHRVTTELGHYDPEIQETIIRTLVDKSNGMYLWVDLQLTDLVHVPEPDIKTQLELLPADLEDTYLSVFRKINTLPQTTKNLARLCFLWALHAKELLYTGRFIDVVSLAHKTQSGNTKLYDERLLQEVTFGLLTFLGFFPRVRPIHFSLQEFVTRPERKHPPDLQRFLPDAETANAEIAIMCLQHLMLDVEPRDIFDTCLSYCGRNFDIHSESLTTIPPELWNVLDRIFKEPKHLKWILAWKYPTQHYNWPNVVCPGNPQNVDANMFMLCTKLHKIPSIWARYKVDEMPSNYPKDYFFLAAMLGLDDILENIISQGININKVTADLCTALHCAIGGSELRDDHGASSIKVLLNAGADWNYDARHIPSGEPRDSYETPLNDALLHQAYVSVHHIVLHHSFNFATYMKTIPVKRADNIRVLIKQGADINQRDEYGDTALQIAREDGRQDCVEILEELGALE